MEFSKVNQGRFLPTSFKKLSESCQQLKISISCCCLCHQSCQNLALLCQYCFEDITRFELTHLDNDLLNWPAINKILPKAQFDHLISLAPYAWPFSQWVSKLKYNGQFELATLLAQLLADYWLNHLTISFKQPCGIIAVPLHIKKWQLRGFNQAHLIAKQFAKQVNTPYFESVIARTKHTDDQVGQTGSQRRKNMSKAFSFIDDKKPLPAHVILLDDDVTTGSTANEICKLLKQYGVNTVTLVSICLSLPDGKY